MSYLPDMRVRLKGKDNEWLLGFMTDVLTLVAGELGDGLVEWDWLVDEYIPSIVRDPEVLGKGKVLDLMSQLEENGFVSRRTRNEWVVNELAGGVTAPQETGHVHEEIKKEVEKMSAVVKKGYGGRKQWVNIHIGGKIDIPLEAGKPVVTGIDEDGRWIIRHPKDDMEKRFSNTWKKANQKGSSIMVFIGNEVDEEGKRFDARIEGDRFVLEATGA